MPCGWGSHGSTHWLVDIILSMLADVAVLFTWDETDLYLFVQLPLHAIVCCIGWFVMHIFYATMAHIGSEYTCMHMYIHMYMYSYYRVHVQYNHTLYNVHVLGKMHTGIYNL